MGARRRTGTQTNGPSGAWTLGRWQTYAGPLTPVLIVIGSLRHVEGFSMFRPISFDPNAMGRRERDAMRAMAIRASGRLVWWRIAQVRP